jgi:hypothetical protein
MLSLGSVGQGSSHHLAIATLTADALCIHHEGVIWHRTCATDLLFITLRKS